MSNFYSYHLISSHRSTKKKVPIKLPSFDSTKFATSRSPEQAKFNAALLLELFNSSEQAGAGSHWQGVRNSFLRDEEVMTMDKCLFMQATMPQEFFDLIGKEGFKIGDIQPEEAEELMDLLPEGWAIVKDVSLSAHVCVSFLLSPCHLQSTKISPNYRNIQTNHLVLRGSYISSLVSNVFVSTRKHVMILSTTDMRLPQTRHLLAKSWLRWKGRMVENSIVFGMLERRFSRSKHASRQNTLFF